MQLGMIGLGRMGANIVRRVAKDGHECVVYDHNADAVKAIRDIYQAGLNNLKTKVK